MKNILISILCVFIPFSICALLSVSPSTFQNKKGQWITVNWTELDVTKYNSTGVFLCQENDIPCGLDYRFSSWIGLFGSDSNNVERLDPLTIENSTPPWVANSPIKWIPIPQQSSGSVKLFVRPSFTDLDVVIFSNGTTYPVQVSEKTRIVVKDTRLPMHVHISLTELSNQIRVSWEQKDGAEQIMEVTDGKTVFVIVPTTKKTYKKGDLCGQPATSHGWVPQPYFYSAIFSCKHSKSRYRMFYRVGHVNTGFSPRYSFLCPSESSDSIHSVIMADVGEGDFDGSQSHAMEPISVNVTSNVEHWIGGQYRGRVLKHIIHRHRYQKRLPIDVVWHVGDLSYATGYGHLWNHFMQQIEPIAAFVPYMVGEGNHERDYKKSGSYYEMDDSGGECGVPTRARFITANSVNMYYSVNKGPVHFLMLNTELDLTPSSVQSQFIINDLKKVDRYVTPWIVVMGHRPMYFLNQTDNLIQTALEEYFMKYEVDLVLWGHIHNFQVTCPVFNGKCVPKDEKAPVHVILGNGGRGAVAFPPVKKPWSVYEDVEHGYCILDANRQNLTLRLYGVKTLNEKHAIHIN